MVHRDVRHRMTRARDERVVIACDVARDRWSVKNHPLSGITPWQLARIVRTHWRSIDYATYAPRVVFLTFMSFVNAFGAIADYALYSRAIARMDVRDDPVFVIGHPRTGTTHLHNVLARDAERFGTATTFDVGFPSGFLSTARAAPALGVLMDSTRPMDSMRLAHDTPQEDEVATNQASACASPYAPLMFMRDEEKFRKFYELDESSDAEYPIERDELERWKSAFLWFVKKLQYKHGASKRLLLKSPVHAARIRVLRELFPNAQFVFISRHPYDVFKSAVNMADKYYWQCYLQKCTVAHVQEFILKQGEILHDAYVRDSKKLPKNALYEMRFDELDADPVAALRALYEHFGWTGFEVAVEPALRAYTESLKDFKKNSFSELSDDAKAVVKRRWKNWFIDLKYDP